MMQNLHRAVSAARTCGCRVVGIVASAGGIPALRQILSALPKDFPAGIVVVQHTAAHAKSQLAEVLGKRTELRVTNAAEGDRLHAGRVFLAPPDKHVVVNPDGTLSLSHTGRVRHVRPSGSSPRWPSVARNGQWRSSSRAAMRTGRPGPS